MHVRESLLLEIEKNFKALPKSVTGPLISENMISPFLIELPAQVLKQAQGFVQSCFTMREQPEYVKKYSKPLADLGLKDPGNKSILMSYDFHLASDGNLKLIEVNTNAAFLAVADQLYKAQGLNNPISDFIIEELKENILEELKLNGKNIPTPSIAIIDENPEQQRLYIEFLLFNELFKSWGFSSQICDYRKMADVDFIYNRTTDFYFADKSYSHLKNKFTDHAVCFSPNPFEYFLLADKQRLIDWSAEGLLASAHLPICRDLVSENAEDIWLQKKKFFFKPKRAFGSKQSYRGESISRKYFDELINKDFIAQEFIPAPEMEFNTPDGAKKFKYDLRFYAYKNRVQSVIARIYQGQVTNSKTQYGGFACVKWV